MGVTGDGLLLVEPFSRFEQNAGHLEPPQRPSEPHRVDIQTSNAMGDESQQAQVVISELNRMRERRQATMSKIGDLDGEHQEHNLVIDKLQGLPPERRCFRLIGDVLVERTNEEVLKDVIQNRDQVSSARSLGGFSARLLSRVEPFSGTA